MTAPAAPGTPTASFSAKRAHRFSPLLRSEWTKIRSVRSTMWALLLLVVLTIGFTALFTWLTVSQWSKADPTQQQQVIADPVSTILGAGFQLSQLTICVLGVLVMASEYSTGMIRSSLLAVPRRTPMLWAKCAVFALVVFVVAEVAALPSYFIGAAILHSKAPVSLGDPGVLRAVIGAGLYLALLGLFALAIGAIVRHTAGAITGIIGFVLVLAPLAQLLPGSFGKHVHAYLPSEAGHLIGQAHQGTNDLLSPWQGFGVFLVWTVVLLAIAAYLLKRRGRVIPPPGDRTGPAPASVSTAVMLMFTRAALGVVSVAVAFATRSTLKKEIFAHNRSADPARLNLLLNTAITVGVVFGIAFLVFYVLLALQVRRGRNWARIVTLILAAVGVLGGLGSLVTVEPPANHVLAVLVAIVDVAIIVLLAQRTSTEYFAPRP